MEREILVQVRGLREITLYNTYRCETSYMKFSLHIAHNPISSSEIVLIMLMASWSAVKVKLQLLFMEIIVKVPHH